MRLRVALPVLMAVLAMAAVAGVLAVPSLRGDVIDALNLSDDPAGADPVLPNGNVVGHADLKIAAQPAPPRPVLEARDVSVKVNGFFSWAFLDRQTGKMSGSANYTSGTNTTESMVKA